MNVAFLFSLYLHRPRMPPPTREQLFDSADSAGRSKSPLTLIRGIPAKVLNIQVKPL
jgi:hypothetical protein